MVDRTRELEAALGAGVKRLEDNEKETVVLQRRAIHVAHDLPAGHVLCNEDMIMLRPCPFDSLPPRMANEIVNRSLRYAKGRGEYFRMTDFV